MIAVACLCLREREGERGGERGGGSGRGRGVQGIGGGGGGQSESEGLREGGKGKGRARARARGRMSGCVRAWLCVRARHRANTMRQTTTTQVSTSTCTHTCTHARTHARRSTYALRVAAMTVRSRLPSGAFSSRRTRRRRALPLPSAWGPVGRGCAGPRGALSFLALLSCSPLIPSSRPLLSFSPFTLSSLTHSSRASSRALLSGSTWMSSSKVSVVHRAR